MSVNRGSHFQVSFVWQVRDRQLSPSFEIKKISKLLEGGEKCDRGMTTKLNVGFLTGKGVQREKPRMFSVGSSKHATLVLPVCIAVDSSLQAVLALRHLQTYLSSLDHHTKIALTLKQS